MATPLPPLPPEGTQPQVPQLGAVSLPSALQALSGFLLLAQGAPQMLPQATQQLETRRQEGAEREIAQFQLASQAAEREQARADKRFDQQLQLITAADAREREAFDKGMAERREAREMRILQLEEGKSRMEKTAFDASSARLLGEIFDDALRQVDADILDPKAKAQLISDPEVMRNYQLMRAKDPKAADAWLAGLSGAQITQTERLRRATEIALSNPGAQQLFKATGLKPEDVFRAELLPQEVPPSPALTTISQITLRRMMVGRTTPEEEAQFAQAVKDFGGTEAINALSDDLARAMEVKYGQDREQVEQSLAELVDVAAGPERVALSTPSPPQGEAPSGSFLTRLLRGSPEDEIKDIEAKLKSPLITGKSKERLRVRLAELKAKKLGFKTEIR